MTTHAPAQSPLSAHPEHQRPAATAPELILAALAGAMPGLVALETLLDRIEARA